MNGIMSPDEHHHVASSSEQRWEFITVTGANLGGDAASRRRVRSHAIADYRRRNPARRRPKTFELDMTPLIDGSLQDPPASSHQIAHQQETLSQLIQTETVPSDDRLMETQLYSSSSRELRRGAGMTSSISGFAWPGPATLLDASRSDPFGTFPIDRSRRSRELWDHLYDGTCVMFRTMVEVGFLNLARESIALSQILSTSSWHLEHLRGNEESMDYCKYSVTATKLLQERLRDPIACTANEVITAVLAFACYANMIRDPQILNIHLDGLAQILRCRGGVQTLESVPLLRVMLYWVDVNGSYIQDSIPRYPQPVAMLKSRSKLTDFGSCNSHQLSSDESLEERAAVTRICQKLKELHEIMAAELSVRNLWVDIIFPGFHLSPILHDLLSMPRGTIHDNQNVRMRECFRLAAVIYLTELRGKFGIDTVPGRLYGSKLHVMLNSTNMIVDWDSSNVYFIWILTVGASSSCLSGEQRDWFVNSLSTMARLTGMTRFHDLEAAVTGFLWCGEALWSSLSNLESRLSFMI